MKKITLLSLFLITFCGFSQSKQTEIINLTSNMTARFTLNNTTSKVTLVLTGPSDRWFALGIGVSDGFSMSAGDVIIYSTALSDRNFDGFASPTIDASQDWTTISNTTSGSVRTLTLERSLTNADANDFQLPYASTNSINLAWAKSSNASTSIANHGTSNRGFATGSFTTLGLEDFTLKGATIFPNPSSTEFTIKTNTNLTKVSVFNQNGALVKTLVVDKKSQSAEVNVNGLQSGVYFLELENDSEKTWKKVIVN